MSINIEPKNDAAYSLDMPNGFWPAFCVETPVSDIMGCEYTDRNTIKFEHDGYDGEWISEDEALLMHEKLVEFIQTDDYKSHRYFSEVHKGDYFRRNQMEQMLEFLPQCGGFRMQH